MQLEHERQPPGSTMLAHSTQPSPAQPRQLVPTVGAATANSCWRGRVLQGWQGMALQAFLCGISAPLSTTLLAGEVECWSPVLHSLVPHFPQPSPRHSPDWGCTSRPHSPLLLVGQHGFRDGELVREAGSSDELGDTACNVHSVCGHKEQ